MKSFISSSLSAIIRRAEDCTLPAESPRLTFAQRSGLIWYPTILSRTLLACWASTRSESMSRDAAKEFFTAFFVISLKVILLYFFLSRSSAVIRCQDIASPSRSGSVARYTVSAFFASRRSSFKRSPFPLIVI